MNTHFLWSSHRRTTSIFLAALIAVVPITDRFPTGAQKFDEQASLAGTISGRVFQDFNGNGLFETTGGTAAAPTAVDVGVPGVTVTAYDDAGVFRGSAVTAASGIYSLAAVGTGPYRIEFSTLPSGYSPSARSTDSVSGGSAANAGSTVQFVADGASTDVNLALVLPRAYCADNPPICSQLYGLGAPDQPETIFSVPYHAGSTRTTGGTPVADFTGPGNTSLATTNQVGSTFGIAYNRNSRVIYAAAFMKKHTKFGPGGTGAIYQVNRATGAVSEYVNLNTVFGANTAGANPHNTSDYDVDNGQTSWNAVGKAALGGMAISDDMAHLFVMNLADRKLYKIPTSGALNSTTITSSGFPTTFTDCTTAGNVRPFAVTYHEGTLYVGAICSSETGSTNNRLRMYVLQADPSTLSFNTTPLFNQRLNYSRSEVDPGASADWNDWTTTFSNLAGQGNFIYPQPMLTDIDFDRGNMIVSLRDRMGDQTGYYNRSDPNNTGDLRKGITGGDMLRACGTLGSWTLEDNGRCGGVGSAPQGSGEGPGSGEYYYQDSYHPNGNPHDEVSNGAAHQIAGHAVMVASIMDPVYLPTDNVYDSGGFRWFVNSTGGQNRGYLAYAAGDFGKANGMGNVTALCEAAPIEIGNRVWRDADLDGVQDPGESGIAGVTVRLYNASNTLTATAVTDASGEYYFVSGTAVDANTTDNIGMVNGSISSGTSYQIRLDNSSNYTLGNSLFGLVATTANQTIQLGDDDSSDSDAASVLNPAGSPTTGTFPVIAVITGTAGANNHTLDFGMRLVPLAAQVSVGGQIFTAHGNGITNAAITLTDQDGNVRKALTGSFGYFRFDGVTAGQTVIVTVRSKRYVFSKASVALDLLDDVRDLIFVADN